MAVAAFNDEPITPLFMCRWIDGGCSGFSQAQSRLASIAKALVTVEHNARREAEPKWVATAERMPKAERSVLIMGHGWPAPVVADLIVDIADGTPTCWSDKYQGGGVYWLDDVTHWMPLPPPPPGGASDV
jgi:hypothetical protein